MLPAIEMTALVYRRKVTPFLYRLRTKWIRKPMTFPRLARQFTAGPRDAAGSLNLIRKSLPQRFFLSGSNRKELYIHLLSSVGGFDSILDDADMVHENKFQALGSRTFSFGAKVDWHFDFKSGKHWEKKTLSEKELLSLGDASDAKIPWEVSRFHQAIWLGKAYWISRSESHTDKYKELVLDWIENNPIGCGVNWSSSMEAAIRAMNLIIGLLYFASSPRIDDAFLSKLLCSLYEHGIFIRNNLEVSLRNGNHYISDLAGLVFLGILFYDTKTGRSWMRFARKELEREITTQVCEDGTDYEKSLGYQRLVAELLTAAYVLLKLNRFSVSENFSERLKRMYSLLAAATMRDGRVPDIGDGDDGRLFRMKTNIDFSDHRDILAVGAAIFENEEMKAAAGDFSELALLLLGGEGFEKFSALLRNEHSSSGIFKQGGFAFLKSEKDFCSFDFGDIGKRGRGGHGHNDILSITISGKNPFIVDRGTYSYSSDVSMRNKLRSTFSHNTIVVDGNEQADFAGLWSVKGDFSSPELLEWATSENQDVVSATHHAYERLAMPVTHTRKVTFNKRERTFIIEDNLAGSGEHTADLMFHFAPGLRVVDLGRKFLALEGDEFALMKFQQPFTIEDWQHSPSYGVLQSAQSARVKIEGLLPRKIETFVFITESEDEMNYLLNRIQSAGNAG